MTNETYLIVSYFTAAGCGVVLAVGTALLLRGPLKQAAGVLAAGLGQLFRRLMPAWLVLAVLFAFMAVSYIDCTHKDYQEVVADRQHLVNITHKHAQNMATFLGIGVLSYAMALSIAVLACKGDKTEQQP